MEGRTGLKVEIRIKGQIDRDWSDWLGGLAIAHGNDGNTVLTGVIPDQAALHGILSKIATLGLELITVVSMTTKEMNNGGGRK